MATDNKKEGMVTPEQVTTEVEPNPTHNSNANMMHMLSAMLLGNASPVERYKVEELLTNESPTSMEPAPSPRKVQYIKFRNQLLRALVKCQAEGGEPEGGHLYLVADEEEFKDYVDDQTAKLPKEPTKSYDNTNVIKMHQQRKAYELHKYYEQQVNDVLEKKFPNGSIGMRDNNGTLKYNTKPRDLLKNILRKLVDVEELSKASVDLYQGFFNKSYHPGTNGAEIYFQEIDDDITLLRQLGQAVLPCGVLMQVARNQFQQAHELKDIEKINTKWNTWVTKINTDRKDILNMKATWTAFKERYTNELGLLYVYNKNKSNDKANLAQADDEWKADMTELVEATAFEVQSLQTAYKATIDNQTRPTNTISIPNTINSTQDSLTMDTMKDICTKMAREMGEAMVKALANQQPQQLANQQPQQQPSKNKGWRQNTYYCWTCGCNSTHHSNQCKRRNEGHQDVATWENKLGGNTNRNWLRLKWVGPNNKTYLNQGDTQPLSKPSSTHNA